MQTDASLRKLLSTNILQSKMVAFLKYALAYASVISIVAAAPLELLKRKTSGVQTQCKQGHFALTFDDGPYKYTEALVDLLNEKNIKVNITNVPLLVNKC
jgi:peptidoglycan/xylan/chitin deacetylase (PgdA/CDA1 family)